MARSAMIGAVVASILAMAGVAQAQDNLKVMVFSGVQNMPIIVAQTKGFFTKRGLNVEVLNAPSSDALASCALTPGASRARTPGENRPLPARFA